MPDSRFARTPEPPYYAVIFASQRTEGDQGYAAMASLMDELAQQQPGHLGAEFARDASGFGITVSYWDSLQAIADWKAQADHARAQRLGKGGWYAEFELRISKVERAYSFRATPEA
jgi:heme-degrading monooxygenase HmoA